MRTFRTQSWPGGSRLAAACGLALYTASLGCDTEDDVEDAEAASLEEDAASVQNDAEILPLRDASPERPCGDRTVANVQHESGVTVTFCELGEGVIGIGESGPEGTRSLLQQLHGEPARVCPGDLYRVVAPGEAVPAALERGCDDSEPLLTSAELEAHGERTDVLTAGADPQALLGNYCGGSGANNFNLDHCVPLLLDLSGDPNSYWCIHNALWGYHDRTMSGQLGGEEGDWGEEMVAACGGSIRFRAYWRWDVGDAWISSLDVSIGSGGWYHWVIAETDGGEDIDVRFKVDSLGGGTHRHAGIFEDW
jgi:hypothetical protein